MVTKIKQLYGHYKTTSEILRRILKDPLTLTDSEKILGERLSKRKENFLEMLEKAVYAVPLSPYKFLLDQAGYAYEDVKKLVEIGGVEETLKTLLQLS